MQQWTANDAESRRLEGLFKMAGADSVRWEMLARERDRYAAMVTDVTNAFKKATNGRRPLEFIHYELVATEIQLSLL